VLPAQVITLEGKTGCRSHKRHRGKAALHLVSTWASANRLVLAQVAVDEKSNTITALPLLLRQLDVMDCHHRSHELPDGAGRTGSSPGGTG
jgi:hypothetical protein